MKKLLNFKSAILGVLSISILSISTINYATDSVLETGNSAGNNVPTTTEITQADLSSATTIPTDGKTSNVPVTSTPVNTPTTSTGTTTESVYKTVDEDKEKDKMPQTGIEDGYIGVLLIVCVGIAIYTFKKVKDYKNI